MKPFPQHDFPIGVSMESSNHSGDVERVFREIYVVLLNYTIAVNFIPAITRHEPWPPDPPDDIDCVTNVDEARRTVLTFSDLAVTPDDLRAGTREVLKRNRDTIWIFYVTEQEFNILSNELSALHKQLPGLYDSVPVSRIPNTTLGVILQDRIVESGVLATYDLGLLGR